MTALVNGRQTPKRAGEQRNDPVAANSKIYAGALVVLGATGYAEPATTATGLTARGVAQRNCTNTNGDGAERIESEAGCWRFINDGTINRTHIGKPAWIVDDQTVAADDGGNTRSVAGDIIDVDDKGVWVNIK